MTTTTVSPEETINRYKRARKIADRITPLLQSLGGTSAALPAAPEGWLVDSVTEALGFDHKPSQPTWSLALYLIAESE